MPTPEAGNSLSSPTHADSPAKSSIRRLVVATLVSFAVVLVFDIGIRMMSSELTKMLNRAAYRRATFAGLATFKDANAKLAPDPNRVVFYGDSITDYWPLNQYFPGKPYVNRGIAGQTTQQMLFRFHQDVLDLRPKTVVILGGANDIMETAQPISLEQTEAYIEAMSGLAANHGIRVVLCSMLPVGKGRWPAKEKAEILQLNGWIMNYAQQHKYPYVDYYDALTDRNGDLPAELSVDGIHPSAAGYAIMAPRVEAALATISK